MWNLDSCSWTQIKHCCSTAGKFQTPRGNFLLWTNWHVQICLKSFSNIKYRSKSFTQIHVHCMPKLLYDKEIHWSNFLRQGALCCMLNTLVNITFDRGRWKLMWVFPALARDHVRVVNSRCGRTKQHYCSRLSVSHSKAENTGHFKCHYEHRPEKETSVYVYFTGKSLLHCSLFTSVTVSKGGLNRMPWVLNKDQCQRAIIFKHNL